MLSASSGRLLIPLELLRLNAVVGITRVFNGQAANLGSRRNEPAEEAFIMMGASPISSMWLIP